MSASLQKETAKQNSLGESASTGYVGFAKAEYDAVVTFNSSGGVQAGALLNFLSCLKQGRPRVPSLAPWQCSTAPRARITKGAARLIHSFQMIMPRLGGTGLSVSMEVYRLTWQDSVRGP